MSKFAIIIAVFLVHFSGISQADTLHLYPSKYEHKGETIQPEVLKSYGLDTLFTGNNFRFHEQLDSPENDCTFYILTYSSDSYSDLPSVILIVKHKDLGIILTREAASHSEIEGTMEHTTNSYLYDADGDGDLDVVEFDFLTDYESPNEYADNITRFNVFLHRFEKDGFEFENFSDYPKSFRILK